MRRESLLIALKWTRCKKESKPTYQKYGEEKPLREALKRLEII